MGTISYITAGAYLTAIFFLMMLFFDLIGAQIEGGVFTILGLVTTFVMCIFTYRVLKL